MLYKPVKGPYAYWDSWKFNQAREEKVQVKISSNRRCAENNAIIHKGINKPENEELTTDIISIISRVTLLRTKLYV